jgi:hypothetical protein
MAKRLGVEDWWDSNVYSWSTKVPKLVMEKVLELVSTTEDITKSQGLNAVRRGMNNNEGLVTWIWTMMEELKLEERILVWHIATHVYTWWYENHPNTFIIRYFDISFKGMRRQKEDATVTLADYMFFLLAARPYMLPYPVSRRAYVQLCSDTVTHLRLCTKSKLVDVILHQKEALMEGTPLQPDEDEGIVGRQGGRRRNWC